MTTQSGRSAVVAFTLWVVIVITSRNEKKKTVYHIDMTKSKKIRCKNIAAPKISKKKIRCKNIDPLPKTSFSTKSCEETV